MVAEESHSQTLRVQRKLVISISSMGAGQGAGIGDNIPRAALSPPLRSNWHVIGTHKKVEFVPTSGKMTSANMLTSMWDGGNHVFRKGLYDDEHENNHWAFAIVYQTNDSSMCKRQHSPQLERNVDFLSFHTHNFSLFQAKVSITLYRRYYKHIIKARKRRIRLPYECIPSFL